MRPLSELAADWPQLSSLLDEALSLPQAERLAWLEVRESLAPAMKATLRRLLSNPAAAETADFLQTLPRGLAPPPADIDGPQPGSIVGPWRLVRLLGEGGMGSVFLAERTDGSLKRPVALKLPRIGWARGLAERMTRERDILATLDHPGIAGLYDAGVDEQGRPWLALEVVNGLPIERYALEKGLSVRERVVLLRQVCEAVAHAHGRLVIHRDLKPANILVTDEEQVRLLDFGIAKLLSADDTAGATALTQAAGRALTPDYASPEQLRGEPLSVATDVYSLGVVAFELLAGARPYRRTRDGAAALEEAILMQDAPLASSVAVDAGTARALRGDLDAILNQALKKRIDERYRSIDALAEDLRRWLSEEPVTARPDSAMYRLRKLVLRRRLEVFTGAAVTLALIGGAGASWWQARQAEAARVQAEQEAATARAVERFIESVFLSNRGDQAQPGAAREATARDLLDRGAERIATELRAQPAARVRLLEVLAGMYEDLNEFGRMRELAEARLAQTDSLAPGQRDRARVLALADLSHALAISGREADAVSRLDEAEALMRRTGIAEPEVRLRVLVRRGSVHRADDPARAAAAAEQAWALAGTLPPSRDLILAAYLVADARVLHGDAEKALPVVRQAVALLERQPELGASVLAPMHTLEGDVHSTLGRLDAAEASYRRGIAVERARGGSGVLPHVLTQQFAQFLVRQERWRDAIEAIEPSWAWSRTQTKDYEATVPMVSVTYGHALVGMGRLTEGLTALDVAVEQVTRLQEAIDIAPRIEALRATAWVRAQRVADAERALAAIDRGLASRKLPPPPQVEQARREVQLARGHAADALAGWRAERKAAGKGETPDAHKEPVAAVEAARLLRASGQTDAALAQARAAVVAFDERAARGSPWRGATPARAWQEVGEALLQLGQHQEALDALERAATLLKPQVDTTQSLELVALLGSLADAAQGAGQWQRGVDARREAAAIERGRSR